MKTTSHFIGIQLKVGYLSNLFVDLYEFFKCESGIIEFQNPNSLHITLYYLPSQVNYSEFNKLGDIDIPIKLNDIGYFGSAGSEVVCYLTNKNLDFLEDKYKQYKQRFPNELSENHLDFVAHATLFRIKDSTKFNTLKSKVNSIILRHLQEINNHDLYNGIYLYRVNSKYRPELQLPIYTKCTNVYL